MAIPGTYSNFKISPHSVAEAFLILKGAAEVEEDVEKYKKLTMWINIFKKASSEQLDKIMPKHVIAISELLMNSIGEFKVDELTLLFQHAVEHFDDAVQSGDLKEGHYKSFCDMSMWMLNVLKAIDSYSTNPNIVDIGIAAKYIKHNGRGVIDIYIYKPW